MKIYCSRRDRYDPLSYVGKNVWVHCLYKDSEIWANFLVHTQGSYAVSADWVLDFYLHNGFCKSAIDDHIVHSDSMPLDSIEITDPLYVLTDAEFQRGDYKGISY